MSARHPARVAALVAGATALSTAAAIGSSPPRKGTAHPYLSLSGHVAGLYPGGRKKLTVVVRNRARRAVRLRSVTTTVRAASPGCSGRTLKIASFRGARRIPARGSIRLTLEVLMSPISPSACQGARFPLTFRGRATD